MAENTNVKEPDIKVPDVNEQIRNRMEKLSGLPADCIDDIWEADRRAREIVRNS